MYGGLTGDCPHCGSWHTNKLCPRIAAIEYHDNGQIKRVEYKDDNYVPPSKPEKNPFDFSVD